MFIKPLVTHYREINESVNYWGWSLHFLKDATEFFKFLSATSSHLWETGVQKSYLFEEVAYHIKISQLLLFVMLLAVH